MTTIIKENLICDMCGKRLSLKVKEGEWVTMRCGCEMTLVYFDGYVVVKSKDSYKAWTKSRTKVMPDVQD